MAVATTPFRAALKAAVLDAIRKAKADGVTGMSAQNLDMVTRPPSGALKGAPLGSNARFYYREMMREVLREREVRGFVLEGGAL